MQKKNQKMLGLTRRICYIVILCVLLMLLIVAGILVYTNTNNAKRVTENLVNQVEDIVKNNEVADGKLQETLKEEYIVRANAVSYVVENYSVQDNDVNELLKIAELMEVDEIHFFNKEGVIFGGTNPEYYDYSMDSGEQMSFFKGMLKDTNLSLCQDMMPNTAEGKEMMYAMVWRDDLEGLVQVGIEPVRLLEELKSHDIAETVESFTTNKGEYIVITDKDSGKILGSTNKKYLNKNLSELNISPKVTINNKTSIEKIDGQYKICSRIEYNNYRITAAYDMVEANRDLQKTMGIVFVYLSLAGIGFCYLFKCLNKAYSEKEKNNSILYAMSDVYNSVHKVNLVTNKCYEYRSNDIVRRFLGMAEQADEQMRIVIQGTVTEQDVERVHIFTELAILPERMKGKSSIFCDAIGKNLGWTRFSFIMLEAADDGTPKSVIFTTEDIDEQKREEEILLHNSNTDALTRLYNRRAYEYEVDRYKNEGYPENIVVMSLDLNELKRANDTFGHAAGDELLVVAADCMRSCFNQFGKIYRVGGDEFMALLQVSEDKIKPLVAEFLKTVSEWRGTKVESIAISCGYVTSRELAGMEYSEIERMADERMYDEKAKYYEQTGRSRRR